MLEFYSSLLIRGVHSFLLIENIFSYNISSLFFSFFQILPNTPYPLTIQTIPFLLSHIKKNQKLRHIWLKYTHALCILPYLPELICASILLCLLVCVSQVTSVPTVSYNLSPFFFPWSSQYLGRRDLMETSHSELSVPRTLIHCIFSSCEYLCFFPVYSRKKHLVINEQGTDMS